ncbi:calmodulin-like protein 4 isoform X3 [Monodelphis domestica]|uniref:calmodulin-like protein 4 isoform X3 n=1 Tax=Monodelphis domestica TaxID=13616 RepID=UPI0024E1C841|nr:calmodulin-like protein 4 isoform X3 [Monodelphis domestica]
MAKFLSQDQIHEFKECFSLYDKGQRGRIKANDLLVVMRCLGASPTPGEVGRHLLNHKLDRNSELDFSTFLTIMHKQMQQEEPQKEILLAMLMTDKEKKGYITAEELRSKLTKMGERLTNKEGPSRKLSCYLVKTQSRQLKIRGPGVGGAEGGEGGGRIYLLAKMDSD